MNENSARLAVRGIALKDRTPAQTESVLREADQDDGVIAPFLWLHKYAQKENLGMATLGHHCGIPQGTLSPCFNGIYTGDYEEIAKRIQTFIWRLEQKEKYGGLTTFVETELSKVLWAVYEKTRIIRRIQIVQGPEQTGKTRSAAEYTERNNSGRTILVSLPGGSKSGAQDFIWSLADTLGVPYTIKLREKRIRIRHALTACDLILIDEAHLMFHWTDQSLREFFDYLRTDIHANGERGVVLIGTGTDILEGIQKWKRRAGYNIGQLLGRMRNEVVTIDPASDIVESDVRLLVERYYKPSRPTLAKLVAAATRENLGHYNLVLDVMTEAWTQSKSRRRDLDDDTVNAVLDRVMNTLKTRKDLYS